MDELYGEIAHNIKKCRRAKGLSQEKLAEAAGLSRNYISLVETGQDRIGMQAFMKIKLALGVSAGELFGDLPKD